MYPLVFVSTAPTTNSRQTLIYFMCLWIYLLWMFHANVIIHPVTFTNWSHSLPTTGDIFQGSSIVDHLPLLHSFLWRIVFEGFRFLYTLCTKTNMITSLGRQPWIIHSGSLSQAYWSLSLSSSHRNSNGTFQPVFPDQIGPWWLEQTWQEPEPGWAHRWLQ